MVHLERLRETGALGSGVDSTGPAMAVGPAEEEEEEDIDIDEVDREVAAVIVVAVDAVEGTDVLALALEAGEVAVVVLETHAATSDRPRDKLSCRALPRLLARSTSPGIGGCFDLECCGCCCGGCEY
eukprot:m.99643 g.99643  ORF g.99643 m.99643 type:complete len:127 (-) comp15593_c2_seq2:157-537(-)